MNLTRLKEFFQNPRVELLSGLTVSLALAPEAIAFAFIAGVAPLVGLYAAFFVGLITSLFGGRRGMISGATGALAVVMVHLVQEHGMQYLFATVVLMGILQMSAGILHLGRFIKMVPHSVMLGFVNGLAIVIFLAQIGQFKETVKGREVELSSIQQLKEYNITHINNISLLSIDGFSHSKEGISISTSGNALFKGAKEIDINDQYKIINKDGNLILKENDKKVWLSKEELLKMAIIIAITMAIMYLLPRVTTKFPAALAGILVSSLIVIIFNIDTKTVGDMASISGGLPKFAIPMVPFNLETLKIILPYALILAAIGLIESLLTLTLIDDMTNTKGQNSRECLFQGVANVVTGFFGGMGGCAMIGQSMINIKSGGRTRLSGTAAAIFLLCFILFASSVIELIPIAALIAVMFMVVIATFEWSFIKMFNKIPRSDFLVIILVSAMTVLTDLAIAVIVGVVVSALVFAWKSAKEIYAEEEVEDDEKTYIVHGQLFFASDVEFKELFNYDDTEEEITIDFQYTRLWDQSAIEAVNYVAEKYLKKGKKVHLVHLSKNCIDLIDKADNCIISNDDPSYRMAVLKHDNLI